jgi:hypothetical protein
VSVSPFAIIVSPATHVLSIVAAAKFFTVTIMFTDIPRYAAVRLIRE